MMPVSQVTSSVSILPNLIRLAGVSRLESVQAASAALLSVHDHRVWQDSAVRVRTH